MKPLVVEEVGGTDQKSVHREQSPASQDRFGQRRPLGKHLNGTSAIIGRVTVMGPQGSGQDQQTAGR